jgi:hypothetical protein
MNHIKLAETTVALSPEEVDILIESLRTWGTPDMGCRAINKAFATEAHALCDRLVAERRERRAHAEALADGDCPDDITLCNVCGYDIDGDDLAFACNCPNDIDLDVGSLHPER